MRCLNHPNIVLLKTCYYTTGDKVRAPLIAAFLGSSRHVYSTTVTTTCLPHTGFAGVWTPATRAELICHQIAAVPALRASGQLRGPTHAFLQPDEVYLNLVLEFIPDTVYRIERQHSKSKYIISVIQTKVNHVSVDTSRWYRVDG